MEYVYVNRIFVVVEGPDFWNKGLLLLMGGYATMQPVLYDGWIFGSWTQKFWEHFGW
jgi:hypothetical protein